MPPAEAIFIGRHPELSAVSRFLDLAAVGPCMLLIEGEPGIGKTALWRMSLTRARERSSRVLVSRPSESETSLPFAALKDLLDEVLDDHLPALPDPQREAIEVALLRRTGTSRGDHQTVSYAALEVLRAVTAKAPTLLAIDDVQWLDLPSARVLEFVLRRLDSEPLAVVASLRSGERARIDSAEIPWEERIHRLHLGPMTVDDIGRIVMNRLDLRLSGEARTGLHRATGGNPFYALELGRALERRGVRPAPGQPLPIPEELGEVLADHLSDLSPDAREALLLAAAMARPTVSLVRAASGDRERSDAGLAEAEEGGVIEVEGEEIRPAHPLLASVVFSRASPAERRRVHGALANVLPEPEERAQHLALATVGADEQVAAVLDDAARRSAARGAPEAAAHLSELAASLTPRESRVAAWRRLIDAAQHHLVSGQTASARELLQTVIDEAPPGPLRADALRRLGNVRARTDSFPAAVQLLSRALDEAGDDMRIRAAIERDLTFPVITSGDTPGGLAHARAALELAERLGDRGSIAQALASVAAAEFILGNGMKTELIERAVSLEESIEDFTIESFPSMVLAAMLLRDDRLDEARSVCRSIHRMVIDHGYEISLPFLMFVMSEIECWAGNLELAAEHASQGYEAAVRNSQLAPHVLYAKALAHAHLGRIDEAREAAEEGFLQSERTGGVVGMVLCRSVLGFIELSVGNPAGTDEYLGLLANAISVMGNKEGAGARFLPDEIEALIALGDEGRARPLVDRFEAGAEELDRTWALAASARCRALLLAATGDPEGATAVAERALVHHDRLSQPFERARTLLVLGTAQRRARKKRDARDALEQAVVIFEQLGTPLWAAKARAELARVGGRSSAPRELTPTEERVAELVASGMTNREVADALYMSVHTVEGTLSRVFRKLGVRSRTELAARRADLGN